jgi:hypothetical protein
MEGDEFISRAIWKYFPKEDMISARLLPMRWVTKKAMQGADVGERLKTIEASIPLYTRNWVPTMAQKRSQAVA